jgi:hypothetical protein
MHPYLTPPDQDRIVDALFEAMDLARKAELA